MSEPAKASAAGEPAAVDSTTVAETPARDSAAKGTYEGVQPVAELATAPGEAAGGASTNLGRVESLRRCGARVAFTMSTAGFGGLIVYELWLAAHAKTTTWQLAAWRAAIVISAALFSYALLRAADRFSTPLDMLWRVDLERAKAKSRGAEESALEMLKGAAEVVKKLQS